MNPYREPSPRDEYWDDPQPDDDVRVLQDGFLYQPVGTVVDYVYYPSRNLLRVAFDFTWDYYAREELIVVARPSRFA